MECMEAKALKSSFTLEKPLKIVTPNTHGILDDICCGTGDDFFIDDFFDIPSEENMNNDDDNNNNNNNNNDNDNNNKDDGLYLEEEDEENNSNSSNNSLSSFHEHVDDAFAQFSNNFDIKDDDMQELELWSHFMDDSALDPTLPCPKTGFTTLNRVEPGCKQNGIRAPLFPTPVRVKKRSKRRSRSTGNWSWFSGFRSKPEPEPDPESESSLSSESSVHRMSLFYYAYGKPEVKKPRNDLTSLVQRKCSHCQVTKTPQWRAGPDGPKTLCNACGVRFKSGRLFPEYRPACSPTFSSEVHSNSHRKVLEMRRRRELNRNLIDNQIQIS